MKEIVIEFGFLVLGIMAVFFFIMLWLHFTADGGIVNEIVVSYMKSFTG